jgi:putative sterol carrier protein
MTLSETTQKVSEIAKTKKGTIGAKIRFKFDEGVIYIDDTQDAVIVNNEDGTPDCVVRVSLENFNKLLSGSMNAMGAYMMGKIKIDGDMSVAMKLSNLF